MLESFHVTHCHSCIYNLVLPLVHSCVLGSDARRLSTEWPTETCLGYAAMWFTKGIWLCGGMLDEDWVNCEESVCSEKDYSESSTAADSECNDSLTARELGLAGMDFDPVTEMHFLAPYSAVIAEGMSCKDCRVADVACVVPFIGLTIGVLKACVT